MTIYLDHGLVDLLLKERLYKAAQRRRSHQLRRAGMARGRGDARRG